jgi:hypothetical protein
MKGGKGKNLRYVPWGRLRKDEDGNVIGFLPQAFRLREGEDYLSVNWLEYYEGDRDAQIRLSVWAIRASFPNPLGPKSAFGIANIARIKEIALSAGARLRIIHEPEGDVNPGHAGVRRLPADDLTLLEALAADAFTERVSNAEIAKQPSRE